MRKGGEALVGIDTVKVEERGCGGRGGSAGRRVFGISETSANTPEALPKWCASWWTATRAALLLRSWA